MYTPESLNATPAVHTTSPPRNVRRLVHCCRYAAEVTLIDGSALADSDVESLTDALQIFADNVRRTTGRQHAALAQRHRRE